MLKAIAECNCDFHPYALRAGTREFRVSISGYIRFKPDQEQPVRMKIYRAATNDGKYSLIYNDILKNFQRPETRTLQAPVRTQEIRMINGVQTTVTRITGTGNPMGASLNFNIADAAALDCGSNNVFYKIKLCSESGLPLTESNPLRVPLVPRPVVADDLKTWTWTPLFPGKDPLLGVLQNGQTAIPVSNAPVEGQLASALSKQNRFNPPVYFKSAAPPLSGCWRYSRSGQNQMSRFVPDAIEIKPVFSKNRLFEIKGQAELRSLKIDGRKVSLQADSNISTQTIRKVTLNYPGTPVAELEFAYGGKTNTLRVQLPPVPTGLRAQLLDDGSVKLTWDPLAGRIDQGQFTGPPDIKLLRDQKVIHTCDINQTEFIDKQTAPDRIYAYSMALDDANIKAQVWTKEKGLTETRILLENLENPYPESSKAIVYTYPQKPAARPVRISFWEPALCYERTGGPGMRLFSAAVRKLGQEADFELLDRTSRNHVVEEKVLTMSYEKSILIKTLSADFTVLVRDYSRQQGNGAELWLIQNKAFDYKDVIRSGTWILPSNADDKFLAWRIGSISAEELKMPEKAAELGDKLAAEIRCRVFFKSAASPKEASVPVKFIFNPLEAVRQQSMVAEDKAISESLMIGLSGLMPDCNIMTRDSWKTIFGEQALMREQGENLDSDISGTVLISGRVWLENDKKQYAFTLTDIRSGICAGALQCSGTVEAVTAQLANACKKIKLAIPGGNESIGQTKHELDGEHWKIYDCFMKRFGLSNSEKKYKSLTEREDRKEMSKPEFAEKQWQLGNRENAVKILEEMWKTDKSVWWQLKDYHCQMRNYTRAMQIVEVMMQQKNAPIAAPSEYSRLRDIVAGKAPPETASRNEVNKKSKAAGVEVLLGVTENGVFHKYIPNAFSNENLDAEYAERLTPIGQEWNPGGECRTWVKYLQFGNLKYPEYLKRDEVRRYGIWATAFEDRNCQEEKHDAVYVSLALWESEPLFGGSDSSALTRSLKLAESTGRLMEITQNDCSYKFDKTKISLIRSYLAIAKNPDMKFIPVEKKFADYNPDEEKRSGYGSGIYDADERQRNKEYAECDSGRKFLELKLKQIIRERQEKYGEIKLKDMICIAIMAKLGSSAAENLLSEIDTIGLPSSFETLYQLKTKYNAYDLLAFKVYRGDRAACELALKGLRAGRCCLGYRDGMDEIYYLMARAGRKEIITAMLSVTECKDMNSIAAIRWGNPQMLKSLLLEHPELFELELYFYLIDGLNDPDLRDETFNRQALLNICSEYWIKYVLWLGKPLPELYRELTLNYKRRE